MGMKFTHVEPNPGDEYEANAFNVELCVAHQICESCDFKPLTEADRMGYAGCESPNPLIGEFGPYTVIWDGITVNIGHVEDVYGGQMYNVVGYYRRGEEVYPRLKEM